MLSVLLVDDDVDARHLLGGLLERRGYRVVTASDGEGLLRTYAALADDGHPPTVIVTDIDMPRLDGIEAIRALRDDDVQVPAVFVTGKSDESLLAQARTIGDALMTKPIDVQKLVTCVAALAGNR